MSGKSAFRTTGVAALGAPVSGAAQAASITVETQACGTSALEDVEIVGDWSRVTSGAGLGACDPGSGTASGGIGGVRSTSNATTAASAPSMPAQTINGTRSVSIHAFMVRAPAGLGPAGRRARG